jgi:cellobiose phosphorylase
MRHNQRVMRLLSEYAPILGGVDSTGFNHPQDEAKQKQHIFAIRNKDMEEPHWAFVLGHVVVSLIKDDFYEIEYLGLHKYCIPLTREAKTKEQKDMRKKILKYARRQDADIAYGKRMNDERQGIFTDDEGTVEADADELVTSN